MLDEVVESHHGLAFEGPQREGTAIDVREVGLGVRIEVGEDLGDSLRQLRERGLRVGMRRRFPPGDTSGRKLRGIARDPNLVKGFVVTELWAHISKITSPTLYVIGGASRIVPAATQERLKQTLPNVEIVTMAGLGHYPNEEDMPGFLAIVNRFLKR